MCINRQYIKDAESNTLLQLQKFIVDRAGISATEITPGAGLQRDLGIYGDDAVELLVAYGKEFNVDVCNFMAVDYFSGEGDTLLPFFRRLFTGKLNWPQKNLTVGHLVKGMLFGKLDEDVINDNSIDVNQD